MPPPTSSTLVWLVVSKNLLSISGTASTQSQSLPDTRTSSSTPPAPNPRPVHTATAMDAGGPPPPLFLLAAATTLLAAAALGWLLLLAGGQAAGRRRRSASAAPRLPPGSTGLPLIGETLRLIAAYKTPNPEPFIDERVARHGSGVFTTHVFGERTVFSADPAFNRLLLAAEGRAVSCSYPSSIATLLGPRSLLLTAGPAHKRLHSLTLTRLGRPASPPLLAHIDRLVLATMRDWGRHGAPAVRLLDEAKKITFNLTVWQLVSIEPGPWTESVRREYVKLIDGFFSIPFPFAYLLPFTAYGQALKVLKPVCLSSSPHFFSPTSIYATLHSRN